VFSFNVSTSNLEFLVGFISTAIIGFVFLRMSFSYTRKRAGRPYAQGRVRAPSISFFSVISKLLFVSSMLLTLISVWLTADWLLIIYNEPVARIAGVVLVLVGYLRLGRTFTHLGEHYSPSFDAYVPLALITKGCYRYIRHPIYLYNLWISFGLAVASGSILVAANALIGLLFILKIISMEEACLTKYFPGYSLYSKKTWRLIPFVY